MKDRFMKKFEDMLEEFSPKEKAYADMLAEERMEKLNRFAEGLKELEKILDEDGEKADE